MLSPTLFVQGIFKFALVLMGAFLVWQLVSSSKGLGARLALFAILILFGMAYWQPSWFGQ